MTNVDFKDLVSQGFEPITDQTPSRLLIGSQGLERTGKTGWALTTLPDPIGYIGLDFGHEGVIERAAKTKQIVAWFKNIPPVSQQTEYLKYWNDTNDHIQKLMKHPQIRSIVLDSGTDIWELLRLAEFGALTKSGDVKKLYSQINQAYRSLIRMAYDREINLVVTHKVKKLYMSRTLMTQKGPVEQEYWDGKSYERAGFGEGGFLIQIQIEHMYDEKRGGDLSDRFGIKVIDCRQNMDIQGMELWGPDNNFPTLAQYVFPDSDEREWY